jgi:16S rRNA (guanine527-N7)-methyltransferase
MNSNITLSDSVIRQTLGAYGFQPSETVCEQIRRYITILQRWNKRISLTAVSDPLAILQFHFGESVFALTFGDFIRGRLADVGSGAGFPGIPLYLARPDLGMTLIEPTLKKCVFLQELKRDLGLEGVEIFRGRMEDLIREERFAMVTARALGQTEGLMSFAERSLEPSGTLMLWIGEALAESIRKAATPRGWHWSTPVRIPNSDRRFLLSGSMSP